MRNTSLLLPMMVAHAPTIKIAEGWSIETNHNVKNSRESASEGRRGVLHSMLLTASIIGSIPSSANSSNPKPRTASELQRIYDAGASGYDAVYTESIVSRVLDFSTLRTRLLERASGDVLELGVGTGLNLSHYPSSDTTASNPIITSYTGIDLSTKMMEQAIEKFKTNQVASSLQALQKDNKVRFVIGDVNNLEGTFGGKGGIVTTKFDTIIDTFGLCVFPEPSKALAQAKKLLNPGGRILLLEHQDSIISKTLSPTRGIADVSSTCRYDDNVRALVRGAGFEIISSKNLAGGFLVEVVATSN